MHPIAAAGAALAVAAVVAIALSPTPAASPTSTSKAEQQTRSRYLTLSRSRVIRDRTVVLRSRLVLARRDSVFVQSNGTYAPLVRRAAASVVIEIDGRRVTNEGVIDWRRSVAPVRHSFNVIGAARLSAGAHRVKLVARPIAGRFTISKTSDLSILVHPAKQVSVARVHRSAGPFAFETSGRNGLDAPVPHRSLAAVTADTRTPTIALAAGSAQRARRNGDAMLGIYLDHRHPGNGSSLWTVNDICACAETRAPLYSQALLEGPRRRSTVSLEATEYPWNQPGLPVRGEDPIAYLVRRGATLVVLGGGMRVIGSGASLRRGNPRLVGTTWDWICIGSSSREGRSGLLGCPDAGSDVRLASETFQVPDAHSGVVMFAAKTRVQADMRDVGGTVSLWLTIDGVQRGSTGIQALTAPSAISQRTISASYLAAGRQRLPPGRHTVEVHVRVEGSFAHLVVFRDLPLVWFD